MQTVELQSPNHLANVSADTFIHFLDEYRGVDAAVAEAVGVRKELRSRIKGAGFDLKAFDRARRDAEMSGEIRERREQEYLRYMRWLGMPIGYQADIFGGEGGESGGEPSLDDLPEIQRDRISLAGGIAARAGKPRGSNPWSPGSLAEGLWDDAWAAAAPPPPEPEAEPETAAPPQAGNDAEAPRRRRPGRPPGRKDSQPRRPRGAAVI